VRLYDYASSANCYKPRLLLALLERECERVPIDIFAGETLTDEYEALNPAREVPVLELDDGTILTQSNAILWFLAEDSSFLDSRLRGQPRPLPRQRPPWAQPFDLRRMSAGEAILGVGSRFRVPIPRPGTPRPRLER
jgi:Glutathione S-transferase, N-terminal domain